MATERLNPTLFDKLLANSEFAGLRTGELRAGISRGESGPQTLRYYELTDIDRFTEEALRDNVRREIAWIMNTTNLESLVDLSATPHVKTSVLNFGVADLTGKARSQKEIELRARKVKDAIIAFEPRMDRDLLNVVAQGTEERENAVTFVITGDITSAVQSLRVQYFTDVEVDTGAATVRE
jgi:type VI secretion system protein ImpF